MKKIISTRAARVGEITQDGVTKREINQVGDGHSMMGGDLGRLRVPGAGRLRGARIGGRQEAGRGEKLGQPGIKD